MTPVTERQTAAARKEAVLAAAASEFAQRGLDGGSTDTIARRAGISQPYLFRLFGTKKELFIAVARNCFTSMLELFEETAAGKNGEAALEAIAEAYMNVLVTDPDRLRGQLQTYAACGDPDIRAVVRQGYGELVEYVRRVSGADDQRLTQFFAMGMLCNVVTAMDVADSAEPWAQHLVLRK